MYRLYFDEVTGQYFVADECSVEAALKRLEEKDIFTLNEYCRALGIAYEDPFDCVYFKRSWFDPGCIFYKEYGFTPGSICAMRVGIYSEVGITYGNIAKLARAI